MTGLKPVHPDFPRAHSGDVHISLGSGYKYFLCSSILRRGSSFFAKQLTEEKTKVPEAVQKDGSRAVRWRLKLTDPPEEDQEGCGKLILIVSDTLLTAIATIMIGDRVEENEIQSRPSGSRESPRVLMIGFMTFALVFCFYPNATSWY